MGTFWHVLRKNARTKLPSRFIFYDCETFPETYTESIDKHALKLGHACHATRDTKSLKWRETWLKFTKKKTFWDFVCSKAEKKTRLMVVAHNQNFDFMVLNGFVELVKRGWELTRHIITSSLFIARFRKDSCTIMVVDSLNWLRASIKSLGEALGTHKGEIDFDTCTFEELDQYCRQDVEILKDSVLMLLKFIRKYNLGNFQLTRASQTFTAYKHRFMTHKLWIHAHRQAQLLERLSYRGGRNEARIIGTTRQTIYDFDVNSLYPFVMRDNEYPTKFIRYMEGTSVIDLTRLLEEYAVIAKVLIEIKEPFIGLKTERLIFPIGKFWVTLTTPELKRVLQRGIIHEVKELAIYEKAPIFKKWVDELYELRLMFKTAGNKVFEEFTKGLLNSLYGKFGQRIQDAKKVGEAPLEEISVERIIIHETKQCFTEYSFGGQTYRRSPGNTEWRDSFPAIASHVTAYARLYLYDLMVLAGMENVFYCDTDSLFLALLGMLRLKPLLHETKLGMLKLEGKADYLRVRGCKDYKLGEVEKIKGIRKDAKQLSENVYSQVKFYKFRSLLRKGLLDAPLTETITKTLKRIYKKGTVLPNGEVIPYVLSEQPH